MTTRRRGATETAYERAVTVARTAGRLGPEDGALVATGRASARLVDEATHDGTVWMREAAIRRHVETLRELELTPGTRPTDPTEDPLLVALAQFRADRHEYAPTPPPPAPPPAAPRAS